METNYISVNCYSPEGTETSSIDYKIDGDTARNILKAREVIKENPFIKYVKIEGSKLWGTTKQFSSTIDDPERKEITDYGFRSDVQHIQVGESGAAWMYALGKWGDGSDQYLTFEIE